MINFLELKIFLKNHSINLKTDLPVDFAINGIASLMNANKLTISFYHNSKYLNSLKVTKAAACFISQDNIEHLSNDCMPIVVDNPYESFAYTTIFFDNLKNINRTISKKSSVNKSSLLGNNISVGDFSFVDP